jgi:hypothetical protein
MRKLLRGIIALAAASTANAATVTYTMSIHESPACAVSTNAFTLYATVSQGDNDGLFGIAVNLRGQGEGGGPATMTLVNRTPAGKWSIDTSDPDYDGGAYPDKTIGFTAARSASNTTGIVGGIQDLIQGANPPDGTPGNLVRLYHFGQTALDINTRKPAPATNGTGQPVSYGNYSPLPNSDVIVPSNPCNRAGVLTLPAGTARIATGTWTGIAPSIDTTSVNTKASVWRLGTEANEANHIFLDRNDIVPLQFQFRDFSGGGPNEVVLSSTISYSRVATDDYIVVFGSNGSYESEVDQLTEDAPVKGSAVIANIGDEAGSIYLMLRLNGSASDISEINSEPNAVPSGDPQYALLHAAYDSQFAGGGFNSLFKYNNPTGLKVVNFDFSVAHPNVSVDQIAAVPEPSLVLSLFVSTPLLLRRRRRVRSSGLSW